MLMSKNKDEQWKEHNELNKKGAEQILSWAYELSQDVFESILEDILA